MQDEESLALYYSSWYYSFIHTLTSIPEFQTTEKICEKLHLNKETSLLYLRALEKMGLVIQQNGFWQHSGRQLHVSSDSNLVNLHHNNWRQQAVLDSQLRSNGSVHFTGLYSITRSDFDHLKNTVLKMLETLNTTALNSGTEDTVVFCCDLFRQDT